MSAPPQSRWLPLLGADVHWVELAAATQSGEVVVCVHGLGGSTVNWEGLAPLLGQDHRVVALDLVGFGRTIPGERRADLAANTELLAAFVDRVSPDGPVVLVGNSMGGLIGARYAAGSPERVRSLALLDPVLPYPGRAPGGNALAGLALYGAAPVSRAVALARRRLRTPEQLVTDTLRMCLADPTRIDPGLRARHVELARVRSTRPELDELFGEAGRAVVRATAARDEMDRVYDALTCPVLLLHGTQDRLVPYAAAVRMARRHPQWHFVSGRDLGHVPELEAPAWVARVLEDWWGGEHAASAAG